METCWVIPFLQILHFMRGLAIFIEMGGIGYDGLRHQGVVAEASDVYIVYVWVQGEYMAFGYNMDNSEVGWQGPN